MFSLLREDYTVEDSYSAMSIYVPTILALIFVS